VNDMRALLLTVALIAAVLLAGIAFSWATGIGTDVHGRPCLTHWDSAEGCRQ
jgi:hypothetical protein